MKDPEISVVLPVYNSEKYLAAAIQSVLDQHFSGFELMVINDGSSDQSEKIILSFSDPRIVYLKNETNRGLIYSLNRGIENARGKYLARMDADDLCLPQRFVAQKSFLDRHPEAALVASVITFMDDQNRENGPWLLDRQTTSPAAIRRMMPYENCIAHPTVMIRTAIIKQFNYHPGRKNMEDYDLWLRMLNRGLLLAKLDEPLLLYRVHTASVTSLHLKPRNPFFLIGQMKLKFLAGELQAGRITGFTLRVLLAAILDFLKGMGKALKKTIHNSCTAYC